MERIRREIVRAALRGCRSPLALHRISVRAERKMEDAVTELTRPVEGLQWRREVVGGVAVERTVNVGANATLIYVHGGAYGLGSAYGYRGVAGRLGEAAWMAVVVPDYSLAPEAVALEEMVQMYAALWAGGMDPQTTVIAGDSAGGGLALKLAMALRDRGIAVPAALGLIGPVMSWEDGNVADLPPIVSHERFDELWHDIHLKAGVRAEADSATTELGAQLRAHVQGRAGL